MESCLQDVSCSYGTLRPDISGTDNGLTVGLLCTQVLVQRYDGSRDGVGTGCLHGRGRLELLSGDVFHGTWQQGRLTGTAEISLKNGFEYSGTVTDSCLTGSGVSPGSSSHILHHR